MKVVDKIKKAEDEGRTFWSFEYFPPKTEMVCNKKEKGAFYFRTHELFMFYCFRVFKTCMIVWKECNVLVQNLLM